MKDKQKSTVILINVFVILWLLSVCSIILLVPSYIRVDSWYAMLTAYFCAGMPIVTALVTFAVFPKLSATMRVIGLLPIFLVIIGIAYDLASM